jgi:hypothetical protein
LFVGPNKLDKGELPLRSLEGRKKAKKKRGKKAI